jgi:pyruvate carboxylase
MRNKMKRREEHFSVDINGTKEEHQTAVQSMFSVEEVLLMIAALVRQDIHHSKVKRTPENEEHEKKAIQALNGVLAKMISGLPEKMQEMVIKHSAEVANYHMVFNEEQAPNNHTH